MKSVIVWLERWRKEDKMAKAELHNRNAYLKCFVLYW